MVDNVADALTAMRYESLISGSAVGSFKDNVRDWLKETESDLVA